MTEDPHTVLHVYEGDGGVIIRENGNVSTFGVQSDAVTAAFYAASDDTDEANTRDLLATIAGLRQQLERANAVIAFERKSADHFETSCDEWRTRAERAEADNARLRSALEEIDGYASMYPRVSGPGTQVAVYRGELLDKIIRIAREARQAAGGKNDG